MYLIILILLALRGVSSSNIEINSALTFSSERLFGKDQFNRIDAEMILQSGVNIKSQKMADFLSSLTRKDNFDKSVIEAISIMLQHGSFLRLHCLIDKRIKSLDPEFSLKALEASVPYLKLDEVEHLLDTFSSALYYESNSMFFDKALNIILNYIQDTILPKKIHFDQCIRVFILAGNRPLLDKATNLSSETFVKVYHSLVQDGMNPMEDFIAKFIFSRIARGPKITFTIGVVSAGFDPSYVDPEIGINLLELTNDPTFMAFGLTVTEKALSMFDPSSARYVFLRNLSEGRHSTVGYKMFLSIALDQAIYYNSPALVRRFIDAGAVPTIWSAISVYEGAKCKRDYGNMIRVLVAHGLDINSGFVFKILHFLDETMLQDLIDLGLDLNCLNGISGFNLLTESIIQNYHEIIPLLEASGLQVTSESLNLVEEPKARLNVVRYMRKSTHSKFLLFGPVLKDIPVDVQRKILAKLALLNGLFPEEIGVCHHYASH